MDVVYLLWSRDGNLSILKRNVNVLFDFGKGCTSIHFEFCANSNYITMLVQYNLISGLVNFEQEGVLCLARFEVMPL